MSDENVEIVRRAYEEGWLDRSIDRLLAHADAGIEFVNPPDAVEPGIRRGVTEVMRAWTNTQGAFDSLRHQLDGLHGDGDVIVAEATFFTRSRGSQMEVAQREVHTWTFRDGRIVRFEWGRNVEEALEAAGLSE